MEHYKYRWFFLAPSILAIAVIFCIISLSSDKWYDSEGLHAGIWRGCAYDPFAEKWKCKTLGSDRTLDVVRAFSLISVLLTAVTVPLALIAYLKESTLSSTFAAASTLSQAIAMLIALVVYIKKLDDDNFDTSNVGWSYGTGWIGVGVYLITFLAFVAQAYFLRHSSYENLDHSGFLYHLCFKSKTERS